MRKKSSLIYSLILFLTIFFTKAENVLSQKPNVAGWAWSAIANNLGVGWISFASTTNDINRINYGVHIDSEGKFRGYAWSDNIGWISFNRNETGAPPSGDPCLDNTCIARLESGWENRITSSVEKIYVKGWARVISVCPSLPCATNNQNGGWDGWIRLDAGTAPVYIQKSSQTTADFHGWAWSDMVIGWISFNSTDPGAGSPVAYKVWLDLKDIPPSVSNLSHSITYCTGFAGVAMISLSWRYFQAGNDPQKSYTIEVQQQIGANWVTKINLSGTSSVQSGERGTSAVYACYSSQYNGIPIPCLEYGRNTRWRVQATSESGLTSPWSSWDYFTLDSHAYPWAKFSWKPDNPTVGEVVSFNATGTAYGGYQIASWSWVFENGSPNTASIQNPTTTFLVVKSDTKVSLTVTDSSPQRFSCTYEEPINVRYPLPFWHEISPTSWMREFLVKATEFLKKSLF